MEKPCEYPKLMAKKSDKKKSKSWYEVEDGVGFEIDVCLCVRVLISDNLISFTLSFSPLLQMLAHHAYLFQHLSFFLIVLFLLLKSFFFLLLSISLSYFLIVSLDRTRCLHPTHFLLCKSPRKVSTHMIVKSQCMVGHSLAKQNLTLLFSRVTILLPKSTTSWSLLISQYTNLWWCCGSTRGFAWMSWLQTSILEQLAWFLFIPWSSISIFLFSFCG